MIAVSSGECDQRQALEARQGGCRWQGTVRAAVGRDGQGLGGSSLLYFFKFLLGFVGVGVPSPLIEPETSREEKGPT